MKSPLPDSGRWVKKLDEEKEKLKTQKRVNSLHKILQKKIELGDYHLMSTKDGCVNSLVNEYRYIKDQKKLLFLSLLFIKAKELPHDVNAIVEKFLKRKLLKNHKWNLNDSIHNFEMQHETLLKFLTPDQVV